MASSAMNGLDWSKMNGQNAMVPRDMAPSSKFLMEAYRTSPVISHKNAFDDRSRRSSALFNTDDQIAVQLLVETTIGDSPAIELLSLEEVEELKKESSRLLNRIDATERRLKLESKIHDAALSLSRLSSRQDKANSLDLSARHHQQSGSGNGLPDQTNYELVLSSKRCEDLAEELWKLERRLTQVQGRLLQHAEAVLQITQRATLEHGGERQGLAVQRPLSGALRGDGFLGEGGMNSFNAIGIFNGSNQFETSNQVDSGGEGNRANTGSSMLDHSLQAIRNTEQRLEYLNTRLRSLILEANPQQHELYDEPPPTRKAGSAGYPDEYVQAQLEYLSNGLDAIQDKHTKHMGQDQKSREAVDERLKGLNKEFHELMADCNLPDEQYETNLLGSGVGTEQQFDYLKKGLETVKQELRSNARNPAHQERAEQYETVITGLWEIIISGEADARTNARQGLPTNPDKTSDGGEVSVLEQFSLQAFSNKIQWLYGRVSGLEVEKNILRRQIQQQRELSHESDSAKDIVVTQLTEELEHTRRELEVANKEANTAKEEMAAVLQRLDVARKELTSREQQRANDDSTTMNEMAQKQEEIFRLEALIQGAQDSQDIIRAETQNQIREKEQKIQALEADLQASAQDKTRLKQQISEMSQQLEAGQVELKKLENEAVRLQTEATVARAELEGAYGSRAQRAAENGPDMELQKEMDELARRNMSLLEEVAALRQERPSESAPDLGLQKEMDELARRNMSLLEEVAALKQDRSSGPNLEMQKEIAELARNNMSLLEEVAALQRERPSESGANRELQQRVDTLQKELAETIDEYEAMTKQSVEFEKEREQLENMIDSLRDRCESVEGQLNDEKLKWLGVNGQGTAGKDGGPVEGTSMRMLRSEFKKMMKDTRVESLKALKAEQEERRKLEAVVRALRKEQSSAKLGAA